MHPLSKHVELNMPFIVMQQQATSDFHFYTGNVVSTAISIREAYFRLHFSPKGRNPRSNFRPTRGSC